MHQSPYIASPASRAADSAALAAVSVVLGNKPTAAVFVGSFAMTWAGLPARSRSHSFGFRRRTRGVLAARTPPPQTQGQMTYCP